MDLKLRGKWALVFGASSGLGLGIAKCLAQEGVKVAVAARREVELAKVVADLQALGSPQPIAVRTDLTEPGAARHAVEKAMSIYGGLDILVTNAGGPPKGAFLDIGTRGWQQGFQTLWLGVTEAIEAALPGMKERRFGRILMITSTAAREAMDKMPVSSGLRAGLLGLTKSLGREVAAYGVTVNALLPGYTNTDRLKELGLGVEKITAQIPAGRLGEVEELGAMATFLASEQAGYVTAQGIAVDGGLLHSL